MYKKRVFKATRHNQFDGSKNYQFMLDMFNKRSRSDKQEGKVNAIIVDSIKPFLAAKLKSKVRKTGDICEKVAT